MRILALFVLLTGLAAVAGCEDAPGPKPIDVETHEGHGHNHDEEAHETHD